MAIHFNFDGCKKPTCFKPNTIKGWLKNIAAKESASILDLNYIFLNDDALLKINIEYLGHNTLTDIITFDNSETEKKLEGDVFISLERVEANAKQFKTTLENELHRVMAHGLLHLCGYKDKKPKDVALMRSKEEACLRLFKK